EMPWSLFAIVTFVRSRRDDDEIVREPPRLPEIVVLTRDAGYAVSNAGAPTLTNASLSLISQLVSTIEPPNWPSRQPLVPAWLPTNAQSVAMSAPIFMIAPPHRAARLLWMRVRVSIAIASTPLKIAPPSALLEHDVIAPSVT